MASQDGTDSQLLMIAHAYHSLMRYVGKFQGGTLSSLSVRPPVNTLAEHLDISMTAVPHAATKDDIYKGFLIPKGMHTPFALLISMLTDVYLRRRDCNWKFMVSHLHFP